jgi:hypothetical protein
MAARVATLGLNPSNREFLGGDGRELSGSSRRFHTLNSLRLGAWADADDRHAEMIWEACRTYFARNPYDVWFKQLDYLLAGADVSYYGCATRACHLDLVPYATFCKWAGLSLRERKALFAVAEGALGQLLRDSAVEVLILNGRSVVTNFEKVAGLRLRSRVMPAWSLKRKDSDDIVGVAYHGVTANISTIALGRPIHVLGFNHNIQSSFGVTREVRRSIRGWLRTSVCEVLS